MYAALSAYLIGMLFVALGVHRLWSGLVSPRWLNWVLLPGTVVAEMAYIFGSLITGGEIRRAKLMDAGGGKGKGGASGDAAPATEAAPRLQFFGPVVAALATIAACGAGILVADMLLGETVIDQFASADGMIRSAGLPKELPRSVDGFWGQVKGHVDLLARMTATWTELDWLNWRVPLFVYLSVCLSIRLAPVRRPLRPALVAIVIACAVIALVGLAWRRFERITDDLWPVVTYVWALLLFLLFATLVVRGLIGLFRAVAGKEKAAKSGGNQ